MNKFKILVNQELDINIIYFKLTEVMRLTLYFILKLHLKMLHMYMSDEFKMNLYHWVKFYIEVREVYWHIFTFIALYDHKLIVLLLDLSWLNSVNIMIYIWKEKIYIEDLKKNKKVWCLLKTDKNRKKFWEFEIFNNNKTIDENKESKNEDLKELKKKFNKELENSDLNED